MTEVSDICDVGRGTFIQSDINERRAGSKREGGADKIRKREGTPDDTAGTPFSFVQQVEIETANRVGVGWIGWWPVRRAVQRKRLERNEGRNEKETDSCGRDSIKRTHINESFQGKTELYALSYARIHSHLHGAFYKYSHIFIHILLRITHITHLRS